MSAEKIQIEEKVVLRHTPDQKKGVLSTRGVTRTEGARNKADIIEGVVVVAA